MTSVCVWPSTWPCTVSLASCDWALGARECVRCGHEGGGVCQAARGILRFSWRTWASAHPPSQPGLTARPPGPRPGLCFQAPSFLEGSQTQSRGWTCALLSGPSRVLGRS